MFFFNGFKVGVRGSARVRCQVNIAANEGWSDLVGDVLLRSCAAVVLCGVAERRHQAAASLFRSMFWRGVCLD